MAEIIDNPAMTGHIRSLISLSTLLPFLGACTPTGPAPKELVLLEALPVEGPAGLQPSGLLIRDGALLTVCDKHPDTVFELIRENGIAHCRTFLEFGAPTGTPGELNLDLEGLATDSDGRLFLLSEAAYRVMVVNEDGTSRWVTPSLEPAGRQAGLFATKGGELEGLAWLGDGDFLLAAERQPRGLMRVRTRPEPPSIDAWQMEESSQAPPKGRSRDFTDLCTWLGRLFALERNRHAVTELLPEGSRFSLGRSWSYAETENDAAHLYSNMRYGRAEGLFITDDEILILLDNNGDASMDDPEDRRPFLFVFENPIER